MKCKRCKVNIDIYKPPFGAYFCQKNHGQCGVCELNSSICIRCNEETKYKSPHFLPEKVTVSDKTAFVFFYSMPNILSLFYGTLHDCPPRTMTLSELQVPIIRDMESTNEEEKEFRKLRLSFINSQVNEMDYFRGQNKLNAVRTLSALITKDLYSAKNNNTQQEYDFRFEKIIRALRETGCPNVQQDNDSDEDEKDKIVKYSMDYEDTSQLKILYPQQSQLRESTIKLNSSTTCLSKINFKLDTKPNDDLSKKGIDKSENSSLNFADFKALSCLNLLDSPPFGFPISIEAISLDRHPFYCPISNCVGKIFLSDFNQHLIHDHPTLPLSQIKFGQFRELFIDVKVCTWIPYTIACFLMRNIVKNFSTPPLKNILPMLLMMGRYRFRGNDTEAYTSQNSTASVEEPWTYSDNLVIWLTGIVPEQCDISIGISVFSKIDDVLSRWYIDYLNPIQNPVNVEDAFQTARRIVLSFRELQMLTNGFKDTLRCQVGLINYSLKDE